MRSFGRWTSLSLAAALLVACAPAPPFQELSPERDGTYRFVARDDGRVVVEGTFTVAGGTVTLDASPGACVPDPTFRTGDSGELTTALWRCGTSRVFINSLDPTGGSSATYERRVVRSVEVCKEWKAAIGGGETCVRRGKENQETFVQSRITLRAVRISTAENSGVVPTTRGRNELVGSAK